MKRLVAALLACLFCAATALAAPQPPVTASGIPLDAPWKVKVYQLARRFAHPAWGWQHAERDYDLALELAKGDGLPVDTDVLFAASMLHDMAAFKPYEGPGEHGNVAAQKSEAILRADGFPMEKFPRVAAAMRGHMYYSNPGTQTEAILLHDADSLDFLGAIGAVRMISLTGESAASAAAAIAALRGFVKEIPPKLITRTAKTIGAQRARELEVFLDAYQTETFGGKLP
jgi:uncharacterized protein